MLKTRPLPECVWAAAPLLLSASIASASGPTFFPSSPITGESCTLQYQVSGGPLAAAASVYAHLGYDSWQFLAPADAQMIDRGGGLWEAYISVANALSIDVAFHDGNGVWDNNGGGDWHATIQNAYFPFTIDGTLDANTRLVASNAVGGVNLWAGWHGDYLYVATNAPWQGNDHFMFVAGPGGPGSLGPAPWSKSGQVAAYSLRLSGENDTSFAEWCCLSNYQRRSQKGAAEGVLEGWFNLPHLFGSAEEVHIAMAPYPTADGGALLSDFQAPPTGNNDGNVDASEFILVRKCMFALLTGDYCCPGDFNRDGTTTVGDLFQYLAAFFAQSPQADLNNAGGVTVQDLFDFLGHWFGRC